MTGKTSPFESSGYDRQRVARFKPATAAVEALGLPILRFRKLNGILNALTMQIEDGGDDPEVNRLLLDALRAAIRFQVGEVKGATALKAIDAFQQDEDRRRARTGRGQS